MNIGGSTRVPACAWNTTQQGQEILKLEVPSDVRAGKSRLDSLKTQQNKQT